MRFKDLVNYFFSGIAWGCTFLVVINLIGYAMMGSIFLEPLMEHFVMHTVGAMIVGVCCGSTSYVYKIESLSLKKQIAIHFTISIGGYLLIAYKLGWMPISNPSYIIIFILIAIIIFISIWTGFYFYNRNEAKKYNAKIKEIEKENVG